EQKLWIDAIKYQKFSIEMPSTYRFANEQLPNRYLLLALYQKGAGHTVDADKALSEMTKLYRLGAKTPQQKQTNESMILISKRQYQDAKTSSKGDTTHPSIGNSPTVDAALDKLVKAFNYSELLKEIRGGPHCGAEIPKEQRAAWHPGDNGSTFG